VAQRAQLSLGLLFVDLDRFKYVNDTLGHAVGDLLLQEVSGRLKACLRGSDLIGRQGGDEFMVMLCEMRKPEDAAIVAEKIIAAVGVPITLGEVEVQVGCSIGIALLSDNNPDMESLMRASDTAMYAAKDAGRNTFQYYNDSFYERVHRRGLLEQELRQAVARKELFLVYQPTVSLSGNGEVVGIEALLRWQRADGELRSPMEFIPIAEDTGEIVPIGLWVLEEACRQACAWDAAGVRFSSIAVNVSAVQLRDPDFASRVLAICARTGWPPTRLVLELTESALMRDTDVLRRTFAVFEENGINLSVDDFGTGFSNLLYLHRFPIQQLKIDRSFVSQMLEDLQVGVLTQAIINLGHALGLRVIAEGVETEVSLRALRNQGCDEAQGYHMTRPLLPADMETWIRARATAAD
jgi:diguanylate cyclase (GGDEF)-like protein